LALKLILIDGNSLLHRAYHALPALSTSAGQPTNAVYGLAQMLLGLLEEQQPDAALVAFDAPGPTFRHEQYEDYKATRPPMDEELASQFDLAYELIEALGMQHTQKQGYEADDIIGTVANQAAQEGWDVVVVSGDRDLMALISQHVKVLATMRGSTDTKLYDQATVEEEYGIEPGQLADMKGLAGDSSDNIPGVPGIGPKTAQSLIAQFGSLETVLAKIDQVSGKKLQANLAEYADQARLSKQLATIVTDMPLEASLEALDWPGVQQQRLRELLARLEFSRLLDRLNEEQPQPDVEAPTSQLKPERVIEAARQAGYVNIAVGYMDGRPQGLALAVDEAGSVYLPWPANPAASGDLFGAGESASLPQTVCALLEDPQIGKRGCELKQISTILEPLGLRLRGIQFDAVVADYLIVPQRGERGMDILVAQYLQEPLPPPQQVVQRARAEAATVGRLREALLPQLEQVGVKDLFERVEMPLVEILRDMERAGVGVDAEALRKLGQQLTTSQQELADRIHEVAGREFNIDSPKQLGQVLFEDLGLPKGRRTKTGWSTAADVLEELAAEHDIVRLVLEYRQQAKLYSTYVKGLLEEIHPQTGRLHTTFEQTVTATGRLSSRNPNLQNIPIKSELGREIRACFVVGDTDSVLLCADYSQIELRILAHLSGDENLTEAFLSGEDIHERTAARIFDVPLTQVNGDMRRAAKTVNYAVIYGMGPNALATQLNITREEAEGFIGNYFARLAGVKQYTDQIVQQTHQDGYVQTICGRRRPLPELASANQRGRAYAERAAVNTPIQGSAADIIKIAMVDVAARLPQVSKQTRMLLQVHDELIFEVPATDRDKVAEMVRQIMESAWQLTVPLSVDIKVGKNWRDLETMT